MSHILLEFSPKKKEKKAEIPFFYGKINANRAMVDALCLVRVKGASF